MRAFTSIIKAAKDLSMTNPIFTLLVKKMLTPMIHAAQKQDMTCCLQISRGSKCIRIMCSSNWKRSGRFRINSFAGMTTCRKMGTKGYPPKPVSRISAAFPAHNYGTAFGCESTFPISPAGKTRSILGCTRLYQLVAQNDRFTYGIKEFSSTRRPAYAVNSDQKNP